MTLAGHVSSGSGIDYLRDHLKNSVLIMIVILSLFWGMIAGA